MKYNFFTTGIFALSAKKVFFREISNLDLEKVSIIPGDSWESPKVRLRQSQSTSV